MILRYVALSAVALLLAQERCALASGPEMKSMIAVHRSFAAVARFRDSLGYLPAQALDICRTNPWWCQRDSTGFLEDGWGRAVSFSRSGTGYEIRSLGPDGAPHTADDIFLASEQERGLIRHLRGCYQLVRPPPGFESARFVLDTVAAGPAEYELRPTQGHRRAVWYPMPGRSVWLEWSTTPSGILVILQARNDSLVGTSVELSDFAPQRRHRVVASRISCS